MNYTYDHEMDWDGSFDHFIRTYVGEDRDWDDAMDMDYYNGGVDYGVEDSMMEYVESVRRHSDNWVVYLTPGNELLVFSTNKAM